MFHTCVSRVGDAVGRGVLPGGRPPAPERWETRWALARTGRPTVRTDPALSHMDAHMLDALGKGLQRWGGQDGSHEGVGDVRKAGLGLGIPLPRGRGLSSLSCERVWQASLLDQRATKRHRRPGDCYQAPKPSPRPTPTTASLFLHRRGDRFLGWGDPS